MKENILIVDDEKDIVRMIDYNLKKDGFLTTSAYNGEEALAMAAKGHPDLILLDLMLPGKDGLEICRILKNDAKTASIPVIMLTAKAHEADKIVGLEMGADDYVTKPFSPKELIARIKAVLRRVKGRQEPPEVLKTGSLTIDLSRISVSLGNRPVELTAKEFGLLKALVEAKGRMMSRDSLLDAVWGFENALEIQTRTVDVHIRSLRKKLKKEAGRIITVKNYGYRFETGQ